MGKIFNYKTLLRDYSEINRFNNFHKNNMNINILLIYLLF